MTADKRIVSDKERIAHLEMALAFLVQRTCDDNWLDRHTLMDILGVNDNDAKSAWFESRELFLKKTR